MKFFLAVSLLGLMAACSTTKTPTPKTGDLSGPSFKPAWEIKDGLDTPESAYYDEESKTIFVAQVSGAPDKHDRKGWISTYDVTGKVISQEWIKDLDAPKGLRSHNGVLWFTDINRVIAVDIKNKQILHNIKINSAKFLNDIAIDNNGKVYISDMMANRIFTISNGREVGLFMQGPSLESPNGLLIKGNSLYVAAWGNNMAKDWSTKIPGNLFVLDIKTKKKTLITTKPLGNLDGLEFSTNGFLVSDWLAGKVYEVDGKGGVKLILEGFKGAADIGYVKSENILIVPRMAENILSAYKL